jgi:hypothetical protein
LWAGEGTSAFSLLRFPPDVRGLALGQTGVAREGDGAAGAANPAVLGSVSRGKVLFTQSQWVETTKLQSILTAVPTLDYGSFFMRAQTVDFGEMDAYDTAGAATGKTGAQDLLLETAWGKRVLSEWSWFGVGIGYAQEKLGDSVMGATFLNAGGLVQLPPVGWVSKTHVGLSLQQWGTQPDANTSLAQEVRLGLASQVRRLGISLELRQTQGQTLHPHAGIEFAAWPTVDFRVGYAGSLEPSSRWSYGMGFRVGDLGVDYAFLPLGNLGDTHHVGLSWHFGRLVEKHLQRGEDALRNEMPDKAVIHFGRALSADPRDPRAVRGLREAEKQMRKQWPDDAP